MSEALDFSVVVRKKTGGHLQVLGQFPSKDAAAEFALRESTFEEPGRGPREKDR